MSEEAEDGAGFAFGDDLPLNQIAPGTTLFVAGSEFGVAEELAISMVLAGTEAGEGAIFVSNAISCDGLLEDCDRLQPGYDAERVGIVDCTGHGDSADENGVTVASVSNAGDLTGIGIEFSSLYEALHDEDTAVRTGFVDVSTLLMYADLRTVFRFLHTLEGRTSGTDGLLLLVVNPSTHDERTVSTLMQLCGARIDVRDVGDSPQLRVSGLDGQPDGWQPFGLDEADSE